MLIVSWNVAGLRPALQRIKDDYGEAGGANSAAAAPSAAAPHPLARYLSRHASPAIFCVQEHKVPRSLLVDRAEPHRCAEVPGHESFWSCVSSSEANAASRGFNGVVTYARIGTVRSADASPLGDPELDGQGRCVVTDHGAFVLFNVYAPCGWRKGSSYEEGLRRQMTFLYALGDAMERRREGGKRRVVLVGDLNLKVDKRDIYWKHRVLNVDELLERTARGGESSLPSWKCDVARHWAGIEEALGTLEAVSRRTTNPSTNQSFDRYCARVRVPERGCVVLGRYHDTAEDALGCYDFAERSYHDPRTGAVVIVRKKNLISVDALTELMAKVAGARWSEEVQRDVAAEAGLNPDSPPHRWMKTLVGEEGKMIDIFRRLYPDAEARFTCWNQRENKRYENEGGRIDFTLVDGDLLDQVAPADASSLRCGKEPRRDPLSEEAALAAATAGGLFESGSYAGGGIAAATRPALDTQFGPPHTGMIYTPPSYSDHVAVSLRMRDGFRDERVGSLELDNDVSTRRAQPHKKQRSIASFFGAAAAGSGVSSSASSRSSSLGGKRLAKERGGEVPAKKPSIRSFFDRPAQGKENGSSTIKGVSSGGPIPLPKKKRSVPKNSVLSHFGKK
ncbi:hypothetical protein ACHAWF_014390 [Thalassiosira exigua]